MEYILTILTIFCQSFSQHSILTRQIYLLPQRDISQCLETFLASQVNLVVKNPPANAGEAGLIPGSERSPGGGNGNPLQYSCLKNPTDRGAWRATVHRIAKSQTQLNDFTFTFFHYARHCFSLTPPQLCTSLVVQTVKNLPIMQETQVRSLGQEDPLE